MRKSKIAAPGTKKYDPECIIPRALVLLQPAASLVVHGVWPVLPQKWGTDYRGRLYVVAACVWEEYNRAVCNARPYRDALVRLGYGRHRCPPLGALVGYVNVDKCECYAAREDAEYEETEDCQSYRIYNGSRFKRNYYWHFSNPCVVGAPLPCKGRIGLFRLDPECAARVAAAATPARPSAVQDVTNTVIEMGISITGGLR